MRGEDLRQRIIPRKIKNNYINPKLKSKYSTTDLIYLDSYNQLSNIYYKDRRASATDHAKIHGAYINEKSKTKKGKPSSPWWLRIAGGKITSLYIKDDGKKDLIYTSQRNIGIRPSFLYKLPIEVPKQNFLFSIFSKKMLKEDNLNVEFHTDIIEVKDSNGQVIYHCLRLGERPKTRVSKELNKKLEDLYNNGGLREGINATGRWYTDNGNCKLKKQFAGIHSPEFEYKGEKYVREITYRDGNNRAQWVKIEKVSWIIRNWKEMPKYINPKGNGKAKYFDLISEEILTSMPFYPEEKDENSTMWQNSMPRGFLNGIDVRNIEENGIHKYSASRGGDFSGECNFLNETFNLGREPIYEYRIPDSEKEIVDDAFNGCVTLRKLYLHDGIGRIGERAFEGINFRYAYMLKNKLVFDVEAPQNNEDIENVIELEKLSSMLYGAYYSIMLPKCRMEAVIKLIENLSKRKFTIPAIFGIELIGSRLDKKFFENSDFTFFRKEFKNINKELSSFSKEEVLGFYKLANALGCFSARRILDKNGIETKTLVAQKATDVLAWLLQTGQLKLGNYADMPIEAKIHQEFLVFIRKEKIEKIKDENGRTIKKIVKNENLELLMRLEEEYPGIFIKVMCNFQEAKELRKSVNKNGNPTEISYEEAFKKYYFLVGYNGTKKEDADIAEVFQRKALHKYTFDKAVSLREKAKKNNIPEHILGEELNEDTILESIEKIRMLTDAELVSGKQKMEEIYNKQFTYEWLSKNDPRNSIIGLFCSCCCTITNCLYGSNIAEASVISKDVQNLVVRNTKGDIIAKGTFYLNREMGYGVINDFEIHRDYRKHETTVGRYKTEMDSEKEKERDLIFEAFKRGIQAFVEKYDQKNPSNPIKQINVGMGRNKLKKQIETLKNSPEKLDIPAIYKFKDADQGQLILYERDMDKVVEEEIDVR